MAQQVIYVAEDNSFQTEVIRAALDAVENYETSFFADGLELYQKVQDIKPDLLILDIILPSLTGLAITRMLKFHDNYRDIPILVTSSITEETIADKVKKVGADIFLPKPFMIQDMLLLVEQMLSLR
ncbi:MAG: PleD family two-component system response regulator [Candidatus Xenobiia bacterium LiM19]